VSYRVAVLVSGEGTNLQAILDTVQGHEGIEVVCVGSNKPQARGLERAREAGVETGVFESGAYADRAERDLAMGDWLEEHEVDLVVLAGFMEILSADFIRRFERRIVNVHPSLLPAFPGIRAIEQAIEAGVRVSGVTVHFVDVEVDSGPIILQQAFDLPYPADIDATEEAIHAIEHELLPRAVKLLARGAVRIDPDSPRRVLIEERADVGGH
jgi:phosphoribosylglycinamide formyltransferase 1